MRSLAFAVLIALAAPAAAAPKAPAAAKPKPNACPEPLKLAQQLVKIYKLSNDATVVGTSCTEGKFPAAGWAVAAWIHYPLPKESEHLDQRIAILTPKGKVLAQVDSPRALTDLVEVRIGQSLVADVDGDRVDEIFYPDRNTSQGTMVYALQVWRFAGKQLTQLLSRVYASDNEGLVKKDERVICDGSYELVPAGKKMTLVLTGTIKRGPKAAAGAGADCAEGTVTLRWLDGKLQ